MTLVLKESYIKTSLKACVRTNEGLTEFFNCTIGLKQGCLASLILFSIFINEGKVAKEVENSGLRGVQVFPDLLEILLLMFADDLALVSDTVVGLQQLLNLLYSFCQVKDLIVNTIKTKLMVYKNVGILAKTEHWTSGGVALEVVPCFNFTRQLSSTLMAREQAVIAKRFLISILSKLYNYGQLSSEVFFQFFYARISPILMYGSEIWGTEYK